MASEIETIRRLVMKAEETLQSLREQVRLQEWHVQKLRAELGEGRETSSAQATANNNGDGHSIPNQIIAILRKERAPVRMLDVVDKLVKPGMSKEERRKLFANVSSAFSRGAKIGTFAKVGRGVYGLKESS